MADISYPHTNGTVHPTDVARQRPPKVIVIGGSLGGLYAGLSLAAAGCEVDIYEQSTGDMQGRGEGLIVQNEMEMYLSQHGIPVEESTGAALWIRQKVDLFGAIIEREAAFTRYTRWETLYRKLRSLFPAQHYHTGAQLQRLERDDTHVTARFADGREATCDMLVGADGVNSACRTILLPDVQPRYAGYVAWEGVVPERDMQERTLRSLGEKFTMYQGYTMQMVSYMIPGPNGEQEQNQRHIAWAWYLAVPEEKLGEIMADPTMTILQGDAIPHDIMSRQQAMAGALLPPTLLELFERTERPSVRKIVDLSVTRMAFGRICLLGDAAFTLRPHTASGASKAADDAIALAESLRNHRYDVIAALRHWERERLAHGRRLRLWGTALAKQALSNS